MLFVEVEGDVILLGGIDHIQMVGHSANKFAHMQTFGNYDSEVLCSPRFPRDVVPHEVTDVMREYGSRQRRGVVKLSVIATPLVGVTGVSRADHIVAAFHER